MNADGRDLEPTGTLPGQPGRSAGRGGRRDESGLVLVWTTLFLMVLLGFAALAVDLGHAYYVSQKAQNAVDAAALAGAPYLPGDLAGAQSAAQSLAAANGFTDGSDGVTVTATQGSDPSQLDVTIKQDLPTWFARAIGFNMMNISKSATAVADQPTTAPVDLMLINDRTGSMTATDLANVKDASKALLGVLDPTNVNVALGTLGPSSTTNVCTANGTAGAVGLASPTASAGTWIAAPYPNAPALNDYQNADGTLNTSSQIVKTINCLNTSSVGTDLGTPIQQAQAYFAAYGRPGAQRAMILMTDGEANQPTSTTQPCKYAFDAASQAKAANIDLVTIGFGVENARCRTDASRRLRTPTPTSRSCSPTWRARCRRCRRPTISVAPTPRTRTATTSSASRSRATCRASSSWPRRSSPSRHRGSSSSPAEAFRRRRPLLPPVPVGGCACHQTVCGGRAVQQPRMRICGWRRRAH